MNKIERVKAALAGEEVDHVPASFWFHFPPENRACAPMAEAHLRYYEACDPDWLKVMNDTRYESPAGYVSGRGELDLAKLAEPLPLTAECYQSFLEGLRLILEQLRNEAPVIVTLFFPFATFNYMTLKRGDALLREQPEAALQEGGRRRFLLAAGCTVPDDTDWKLLRAARGICVELTRA